MSTFDVREIRYLYIFKIPVFISDSIKNSQSLASQFSVFVKKSVS